MGSDPIDSIFFGGEFSKVVRWEEFQLYHRKDGKVVKEGDDLLCATRYALMMLRYAKTKSFSDKVASRDFIPESGDRMTDVHKVRLQVRAPRGTFPGEVVEGWYVVIDKAVVLTDAAGEPINGEKHHLAPGQDASLIGLSIDTTAPQ